MAKRFKKTEIGVLIGVNDGSSRTQKIGARARGGLALHMSTGKPGWTVTHIASGMTIDPHSHAGFGTSKEAEDYIQFALTLDIDWESDLDWETWWGKSDSPPSPLDTIREEWVSWWAEENQRRSKQEGEEGVEEKEPNPIFELFGG